MRISRPISILFLLAIIAACNDSQNRSATLFQLLSPEQTNIDFTNQLEYDKDFNIYTYRNFYNGGGVALGDINNDGLVDIFFTANMQPNRLYLNKGDMQFQDITEKSLITKKSRWSTGVSMADINGDGLLDIYVCNSGDIKGDKKENELYINNGNLTFTEKAHEYGLADKGYSTHAAFFDYDRDGDLDMYLLNNSFRAIGSFDLRKNERSKRDPSGGHKLFRNDDNHFTDVSAEAGIYGSVIGFGLGVAVSDLDKDGWDDIYVSNDFFERDYLYINNHDGTFREELEKQMASISNASMGADIADINNDAFPDVFTTEMLPSDEIRLKNNTSFENWDKYQAALQNGYHHQFTRNALQLNNRNNSFSEIGRLAKVHASDWSWGALIADLNNDGRKDIFVANGIYQDLTNQDYIQYISDKEFAKNIVGAKEVDFKKLIDLIPSNPIPNCAFMNHGGLAFTDEAADWGLDQPGFSNGSAYGDLDNDGDLDLVVNNVNMPSFIYKNRLNELNTGNNFIRIKLQGNARNVFGVGAKVSVHIKDSVIYQEQMPTRGFQSTVDHRLTFGLGNNKVDSVVVEWPDGKESVVKNTGINQEITVNHNSAEIKSVRPAEIQNIFNLSDKSFSIDYQHQQNSFIDFDNDRLLFQLHSQSGPAIAKADVNNDGLEDFYICGSKTAPGALFIQTKNGDFRTTGSEGGFDASDCVFFDTDNDGDLDLYITTGGNGVLPNSPSLADRLYLNDGKGNFSLSKDALPEGIFESNSCVAAADYDNDGDTDLFVGTRFKIFKYGYPCKGYFLQNDGKGKFKSVSSDITGMITDAKWFDYDKDGWQDLVIAGEYMPVKIFKNTRGVFKEITADKGLSNTNGWWNRIEIADINNDGYDDIIAANYGLNSRFTCSPEQPATLYTADFDENGTIEQILCCYNGDKQYPMPLRHDLLAVLPSLKKQFLKYADYSGKQIEQIFSGQQLQHATKLEAYEMRSVVMINNKTSFSVIPLPLEAQYTSMHAINIIDYNNDGNKDIIMGGNFYGVKPEIGIYDAGRGLLMRGDGTGHFKSVDPKHSGINIRGEIRDIVNIKNGKNNLLLFAMNNDSIKVVKTK